MIRNVVLGRQRHPDDAADTARLEEALAGIGGLTCAGLLSMQIGRDAGLRDGSWTFAIINDWVDADAYRNYDLDEEHNRYRAVVAAVCSDLARAQFEIDRD